MENKLTKELYLNDVDEVTDYLRDRFNQDKIYLIFKRKYKCFK